jgi:transcriptional regulator with PAS, ATPase and Fis domain
MLKDFCEAESIKRLAGFDFLDVCLLGETGTGKTFAARLIHDLSPRKEKPFIAVNCAELSPSIIKSELFGYEKGAFTGAVASKMGKFESAAGGTLFLDEIGELKTDMQAKLLKVTEEKCVTRVGSALARPVNLRIIYATNRDLDVFREDLRYRVAAHTIRLRPLRERPEEILPLAEWFIADFSRKSGRQISVRKSALRVLYRARWLGNVRELRSVLEKACLDALFRVTWPNGVDERTPSAELTSEILLSYLPQSELYSREMMAGELNNTTNPKAANYKQEMQGHERQFVEMTLAKNKGNVSRTAVELGMSRYGLIKKLKRLGIAFGR